MIGAGRFTAGQQRQAMHEPQGLARRAMRPEISAKESDMPEIDIYTQPWCPYCSRAVHLLSGKGVAFREINAPHGSAEREEAIRRSGGRTTVPQIFVGDRHIGGC